MMEKPERHCRPALRASQGRRVGPPAGVIGHLVGLPQSSWPTIGYCISNARFQDRVIWPIKKRSEPCDPSGERESDSHNKRATPADPEPEAL